MKTAFHILDAISRDQICTVTRETEDEQEVDIEFEEEEQVGRSESNNTGKSERGIVIHLFGMTAEGESLRCDVEGFRPYFYVKVPPTTKPEAFAFDIRCQTKKTIRAYNKELRETESVEVDTIGSLQAELIKRKELFGFTAGEEASFLKLSVGSLAEFRALKNVFLNSYQEPIYQINSKTPPLQVYESGLDPILRFFHLRDVKPCGWVSVKGTESEDKESGIRVITCSWADVSPEHYPPKPTAPFKTLFWDIECYSLTGAFPVANPKTGKGDPIIQIGCIIKDSEGAIDRTIFVFGDCKDKKGVCDKIDGITVFSYTSESAMLDGWLNWLVDTNPDVWVGYNIFGFDERYVWDRLTALKLLYSACPTYD